MCKYPTQNINSYSEHTSREYSGVLAHFLFLAVSFFFKTFSRQANTKQQQQKNKTLPRNNSSINIQRNEWIPVMITILVEHDYVYNIIGYI